MVDSGNIYLTTRTGYKHSLRRWEANMQRSLRMYNWYVILDSILASNTVGGLLVNCKNSLSQVFFEVFDLSTSLFVCFFIFFTHMLKYSKYLDGIKYMKYFLSHVHAKHNTLVTSNSNPPLQSHNITFLAVVLVNILRTNFSNNPLIKMSIF